jgi:hypothetical protein
VYFGETGKTVVLAELNQKVAKNFGNVSFEKKVLSIQRCVRIKSIQLGSFHHQNPATLQNSSQTVHPQFICGAHS